MGKLYRQSYMQRKKQRKNRLIIIGIPVLAVLVTVCALLFIRKPEPPQTETPTEPVETPTAAVLSMPLPQKFVDNNTASQYIVLYDTAQDKVLYSKNADTKCYPASTTKLLTSIVTLRYANDSTVFTVGDEIRLIDPESSRAYLRIGHKLDLQTLLEAIMLPSGNDAAYVAAANVGRIIANDETLPAQSAIARFCDEMNKVATELGAKNSHFANPDGIHHPNHYTTATDMAKIAKEAYAQPLLRTVMAQDKVVRSFLSGESGVTWYNTNSLLREDSRYRYASATGMKTGHTNEAGYCLIAAAEQNNSPLIAVLMGGESNYGRFEDAVGLFTVCFDSIEQPTKVE